jgi:hypothetical protein
MKQTMRITDGRGGFIEVDHPSHVFQYHMEISPDGAHLSPCSGCSVPRVRDVESGLCLSCFVERFGVSRETAERTAIRLPRGKGPLFPHKVAR